MGSKKITIFLFLIYLSFLTWIILFKMDLTNLFQARYATRSLNLIPFAGTAVYNGVLDYQEILLNILCFIPFGMYMEMLFRKASWVVNLTVICLVSLAYEVIQYGFMIGIADITDLLANGLGGAIGINILYMLTSIWREKTYGRLNALALAVTVCYCLLVVAFM
ncbi:VanZ family protein [Streptococcus oriscaviae]|uniref:VanZ family protein n=1 Tax=Streptococcus oriscaviae TaxID=2781599 RepID=A0ABX7YM52_9STRE|nr:VanZ family protein [Streptococcus oriscaviae]QUE54294.1 VanZ family protein [Streptococcus oriscaviae]